MIDSAPDDSDVSDLAGVDPALGDSASLIGKSLDGILANGQPSWVESAEQRRSHCDGSRDGPPCGNNRLGQGSGHDHSHHRPADEAQEDSEHGSTEAKNKRLPKDESHDESFRGAKRFQDANLTCSLE